MKFATWLNGKDKTAGIISGDMQSVHSFKSMGLDYISMNDFITRREDSDMTHIRAFEKKAGQPISEVKLIAPIPNPTHDIICLGSNYRDHANEMSKVEGKGGLSAEKEAIYFSKRVVEAVGQDGVIESHKGFIDQLDYEAELAVVIGKTARRVSREEAFDHVFGFMCFNDVSARELMGINKRLFYSKSLDSFTVFGPWITTAGEFEWPPCLQILCRVNGETRQRANCGDMIHSVDEVISELSIGMTLDAGTIITTGTPAGVGKGFNPPRYLKPGDVCEVEVEGCGILRNTVV